jgi:hypothetical protein
MSDENRPVDAPSINSAQMDYDGQTVILQCWFPEYNEVMPFALNATDNNGWSPYLRSELARMVEAGEIVISPAAELPAEDAPQA